MGSVNGEIFHERENNFTIIKNIFHKIFIAKNSIDPIDINRSFESIRFALSEMSTALGLKENLMINILLEDIETAEDKQKSISNNFKKVEMIINAIIHAIEVREVASIKDLNNEGVELSIMGKPVLVKRNFDTLNIMHSDYDVTIGDDGCNVTYQSNSPISIPRS